MSYDQRAADLEAAMHRMCMGRRHNVFAVRMCHTARKLFTDEETLAAYRAFRAEAHEEYEAAMRECFRLANVRPIEETQPATT